MSGSVDRILTNWSINATDPLTESVAAASTSGWIDPDAARWSIESFLPIETQTLIAYLRAHDEKNAKLSDRDREAFLHTVTNITQAVKVITAEYHSEFSDRYHRVDPDSDCKRPDLLNVPCAADQEAAPQEADSSRPQETDAAATDGNDAVSSDIELMELCGRILTDAAYKRLTQEAIEKCVGVASQWGVPMSVNFALFENLAVYARGDIIGRRCRRRLRNFYRTEMVDVAIYQRLVVLFQLSEDHERGEMLSAGEFHLRMFKNIPKQDVDMLLPGTTVRLSKLDRAKFIVPSLGGWLMSLQKISRFVLVTLALAAYYSTALIIGLVLAAIGYCVKSMFSYFQTKNRYLLDLTRNLYFQKLDTNAGAAFQIIQQSGRQRTNEAVLAFYAVLSEEEPISSRKLRRKCERLLREAIEVEIDFSVQRAVKLLSKIGAIHETTDGKLAVSITPSP